MASGMIGWIQDHPDLALAGGAVGVLLIAGTIFKAKTPTTATGTTQDLSGLKNGIVYVPTQTSFVTKNQSGVFASNDPALTSVTTGAVNSPTTTKTITYPPPAPPTRIPPPPGPNPPPTTKSLKWTSSHTFVGGETLGSVAAAQNRYNQGRNGMPSQYNITWSDLWQHNQGVITKYANMHGHMNNVWDWVFPGETIVVPVWV